MLTHEGGYCVSRSAARPSSQLFSQNSSVTHILFDQGKKLQVCLVLRLFVMDRQLRYYHKTCPPHKLFLLLTSLSGLLIGVGCFIKQVPAHPVSYIPRINIVGPLFYEFDSNE
jgi:hypothetical protein